MKPKKRAIAKQNRIRAYDDMVASNVHESKVSHRILSGGYRRPGSNKRT